MPASYDRTAWNPTSTTNAPEADLRPAPKVENVAGTTLKVGSTGAWVKEVQRMLGITQDGIFGSETHNAVASFQAAHGLAVDGVVGAKTFAALRASDPGSYSMSATTPSTIPVQSTSGANYLPIILALAAGAGLWYYMNSRKKAKRG